MYRKLPSILTSCDKLVTIIFYEVYFWPLYEKWTYIQKSKVHSLLLKIDIQFKVSIFRPHDSDSWLMHRSDPCLTLYCSKLRVVDNAGSWAIVLGALVFKWQFVYYMHCHSHRALALDLEAVGAHQSINSPNWER